MNTPTKQDWLNITTDAAYELENLQADMQQCFRDLLRKVEDMEGSIRWDWETYTDADGKPQAVYWDGATEEERAMLDYHADFAHVWQNTRNDIHQALTLMERAYERLNELRKENDNGR